MSPRTGWSAVAEYHAARTASLFAGALPGGLADGAGSLLGSTAHLLGARRAIVREQIAASFPGRDRAWVDRITAACYRHFGREAASIARLQRTGGERLVGRVIADGTTESWVERMADGCGTIVVTGHLGNWEVAGAYLAARGVPLAAVVKRQRNARFDAWIGRTRHRLGIEPIYMEDANHAIPDLIAAGRSVALVADQDARSRGLTISFLGRAASTFRGPARLALLTGAPLVFGFAIRDGQSYRAGVELVREGAAPVEGARLDSGVELGLTQDWVARLEVQVRARPEQYFWFHRRWKSAGLPDRNESGVAAVLQSTPNE